MPSKGLVRAALEAALAERGCPICRLLDEREENWLRSVLTESVNDLGMRNRMAASWGFCHRHAWGVAARTDLGGPLGLAIIYESLAGRLLAQCEANGQVHVLDEALPGHSCLYCAAQARIERNYIISFVKYCTHKPFAGRYEHSEGLCLWHLEQALSVARRPSRVLMLRVGLAKLEGALQVRLAPDHRARVAYDPLRAMRSRLRLLVGSYPFYPRSRDYYRYARALGHWSDPDEARQASDCPLCLAEREAERQQLASFLPAEPGAPSPDAWLCRVHAWQLQAWASKQRRYEAYEAWTAGSIRAVARLLDERLQAEEAALRRYGLLARVLPARPGPPLPQRTCAICDAKARAGAAARDALVHALGGARAPAARVCFQHFPGLIAVSPSELAAALRANQESRLAALRAELETYIHKVHWNYKGEPWGPERDSWRRAVDFFVGAE